MAEDDAPFPVRKAVEKFREYLNKEAGPRSDEALDKFRDISNGMLAEVLGENSKQKPRDAFPLVGLLFEQAHREGRYPSPPSSGVSFTDADVLAMGARFMRYSHAAYYTDDTGHLTNILGVAAEDVLQVYSSKELSKPNFFVAVDRPTRSLVLAIRGTATVADCLTDALSTSSPFLGGRAHTGILETATATARLALEAVERGLEVASDAVDKLIVTGHSLGAATAILATVKLCDTGQPLARLVANGPGVACFAFAPPPCFAPSELFPPWAHARTFVFVHSFDVVPRLSLHTIFKVMFAMRAVEERVSPSDIAKFLLAPPPLRPELESFPDAVEPPPEVNATWVPMVHVGKCLQLIPDTTGANGFKAEEVEPALLDKIILVPSMITDHLTEPYMKATAFAANVPHTEADPQKLAKHKRCSG